MIFGAHVVVYSKDADFPVTGSWRYISRNIRRRWHAENRVTPLLIAYPAEPTQTFGMTHLERNTFLDTPPKPLYS
jgi:hypothetical protein